jgi:anti-sigma regulatory factor (Ser/Thr protein kinase)
MAATVAAARDDVDARVDRLVRTLVPAERPADDVAVLAVARHTDASLHIELPATPVHASPIRAMVGRWLEARGATPDEVADVALAVGELVSNVAVHAYPMVDGRVVVNVVLDGDTVCVDVSDTGSWRPPQDRGGGRGLGIVRAVVEDVDVATTAAGTTVRFTRGLDALRTVAS